MRPKITFSNVSKSFNLYKKQSDKLLEIISFKKNKEDFYALKNISFDIFEGEAIGIVGLNGSGKSTLSNLLAQVIPPSSGAIDIKGETSLIAISAGFNNQLSGMDNIELKCLMHGLTKEEIERLKPEIIEFADIGKFIDQPVKNYSSGMKSRLGFAISVHTDPDILIIDEALSVGDQTFYNKCLVKINEFKSQGKTIIFISHSLSQIRSLCNRVIWIHFGRIERFGETSDILEEYNSFIKCFNSLSESEKKIYKKEMLDLQYQNKDLQYTRQRRRKSKKSKKHGDTIIWFQFVALVLTVIVCAGIMFGIKPVQGVGEFFGLKSEKAIYLKKANKSSKNQSEIITQEIKEKGFVQVEQIDIFDDSKPPNKITSMTFGEEIYVEEEINNNLYKVRFNEKSGYLPKARVKLFEGNMPITELGIESFLPLYPVRFSNAYEYFFSFLNKDSEYIKTTLNGLTSERVLGNGEIILSYSEYNLSYKTNNLGITKSLIINDVNTFISEWDNLTSKALLTSKDGKLYLFVMSDYHMVVDIKGNKVTFTLAE